MSSAVDALANLPGTVVVWSGTQVAFAVVFHRPGDSSDEFLKSASGGKIGNAPTIVSLDTTQQPVTIYFDFEGAWASLFGLGRAKSYPRKLPRARQGYTTNEISRPAVPTRIAELVKSPFAAEEKSIPPHLIGPSVVPWSQRRSLRRGEVEWRVFPNLSRLHLLRFRDLNFSYVLFVVGKLRQASGLPDLFHDLVSVCGVSPFLVAGNESSVLLAGLATGLESTKDTSSAVVPQRHVLQAVTNHITNVELFREPLSSLRIPVSHRYDRLVS
jgi:hypothetical protein